MLSRWLGPDLQGPTAPALSGVEGLVAVAAAVVIAWLAAHVTARVARIAFQRLIGGTEVPFTAPIVRTPTRIILAPLEVLGVDAFADSQVTIRVRVKTLPLKQWEVGREFRRRVKKAFDARGIEIPFPHRVVYLRESSKPPK